LAPLLNFPPVNDQECHVAALQCDVRSGTEWRLLLIYLQPITDAVFVVNGVTRKAYRRIRCNAWIALPRQGLRKSYFNDVLVLQDEHFELFERSRRENIIRRDRALEDPSNIPARAG
jgi:hypothetical protein